MNDHDDQTLRDLMTATAEQVQPADDLWPAVQQRVQQSNRHTTMLQVASVVILLGASVGGWLMWESGTSQSESVVASPDGSPAENTGTDRDPTSDAPTTDAASTAVGWQSMPTAPIGSRFQHLALDMDGQVLVWGGYQPDGEPAPGGAIYDTAANTWRAIDNGPFSSPGSAIGVWTGSEAIVLQGSSYGPPDAAAFDPAAGTWRELAPPPGGTSANAVAKVVWTGENVVFIADGWAGGGTWVYDLADNTWSTGASYPTVPGFFSVTWTGTEVMVVGQWSAGDDPASVSGEVDGPPPERFVTVLAYNPKADSWRELPTGPLEGMTGFASAWTGSRLVVIGSSDAVGDRTTVAGLLNPADGTWTKAAPPPIALLGDFVGRMAAGRYLTVWNGADLVLLGGEHSNTPAFYNPDADEWSVGVERPGTPLSEAPAVWSAGRLVQPLGGYTSQDGGTVSCCEAGPEGGSAYRPS